MSFPPDPVQMTKGGAKGALTLDELRDKREAAHVRLKLAESEFRKAARAWREADEAAHPEKYVTVRLVWNV